MLGRASGLGDLAAQTCREHRPHALAALDPPLPVDLKPRAIPVASRHRPLRSANYGQTASTTASSSRIGPASATLASGSAVTDKSCFTLPSATSHCAMPVHLWGPTTLGVQPRNNCAARSVERTEK